jgi:hypothetical protein
MGGDFNRLVTITDLLWGRVGFGAGVRLLSTEEQFVSFASMQPIRQRVPPGLKSLRED